MTDKERLRRWARREYAWRLLSTPRRKRSHHLLTHLLLDLFWTLGNDRRETRNIQRVIDELGGGQ